MEKVDKSSIGTIMLILVVAIMAFTLLRNGQLITGYDTGTYTELNKSTALADVSNVAPVVTDVLVKDYPNEAHNDEQITLYGGVAKNVTCSGTISDDNGQGDIFSANAVFYMTSQNYTGSGDYNYRYIQSTCILGDNTSSYVRPVSCTMAVQWNANTTSGGDGWTCNITAFDVGGKNGTDTDTADILSLTALSVDPTLNFGTLALGNTSVNDTNHTVFNYGNIMIYIALSGGSEGLICPSPSVENIPIGNIHYNCTDTGQNYTTGMTALTNTSSDIGCTTFDLAKSMSSTTGPDPSEKETFWKISIPSIGMLGTCTGTIWFLAKPSA